MALDMKNDYLWFGTPDSTLRCLKIDEESKYEQKTFEIKGKSDPSFSLEIRLAKACWLSCYEQ